MTDNIVQGDALLKQISPVQSKSTESISSNYSNDIPSGIELEDAINKMRKQMNAIILAHYYQEDDIQDIADFIGDSLELSRKAANNDADVILFCGVRFMAEVAHILSPQKTVLLPDMNAGCSLEESCPPAAFSKFRKDHPDHIALTYINCSAEIKALSDIIVTSSNAERIINQIPKEQKIIFAPDRHLGAYLSKKTGRDMLLWQGACVVHEQFSEKSLVQLRVLHPEAEIIAHPECPDSLLGYADHIGSTSSLLNYVTGNKAEYIVLTEPGIIHQMRKRAPESVFYDVAGLDKAGCEMCNSCPYMRLNTMEKIYLALRNGQPKIELSEELRLAAKSSLDRMMEMS